MNPALDGTQVAFQPRVGSEWRLWLDWLAWRESLQVCYWALVSPLMMAYMHAIKVVSQTTSYLVWLRSLSLSLWDRGKWLLWGDSLLLPWLPVPVCECVRVWEWEEEEGGCFKGVYLEGVFLSAEDGVGFDKGVAEEDLVFWLPEGVESCFNLRCEWRHLSILSHHEIRFLELGHVTELTSW